jgi:hypothetical protein
MTPTLYGILVVLIALFTTANGLVYMAVISTLFGATAAAYALGGATITPAVVVQGFVSARVFFKEGVSSLFSPMAFGKPGFWFLLLTIWAIFSAVAFPRLFEGQFLVNALDRSTGNMGGLQPIGPVSMNITQTAYVALGLFTFAAMRITLQREGGVMRFAKAILWLASLNIIAASMDFAEHYLGIPSILPYIKNATYIFMGGEVGGLMRIKGTFAEASVFSSFTLTLTALTHTLWMNGVLKKWAGLITAANLGLLMISTSGTAYVSLAICVSFALAYTAAHTLKHGHPGIYINYVYGLLIATVLLAGVLLFIPPALDALTNYFSIVIGKKLTSESGIIRAGMNAQAIQSFFDTYGLGTGMGSNRASSFALVLISNLGWVGTLLFSLFIYTAVAGRERHQLPKEDAVIVLGARHAVIANLIAACVSSVVFDLGVLFYILAAAATSELVSPMHRDHNGR